MEESKALGQCYACRKPAWANPAPHLTRSDVIDPVDRMRVVLTRYDQMTPAIDACLTELLRLMDDLLAQKA